jgi:hypothetical protein
LVGSHERSITQGNFEEVLKYLKSHRKVRDVLLSGGDPLLLENERLEEMLSRLRALPHIEVLRIGTRVPVTLPQRITGGLVRMLKKYHPLMISIHFTHPKEITDAVRRACNELADAGIPLRGLVSACAAGKIDGRIVLDLNDIEDKEGEADVPVAFIPQLNVFSLLQMDGLMSVDEYKGALSLALQGCRRLYEMQIEALKKGERIEIRGFGSFHIRTRKSREGRNPKSGQAVHVPEKKIPC